MSEQQVLELNRRLHEWMEKYNTELENDISHWLRKHAIDDTDDLSRAFGRLSEAGRVLQIGVVGRVKAGKSSLLNALIFDGHSILPRAATPMTAALTTLNYGETFSAQVQFYNLEDRRNIEQNALRYQQRLREEESRAADTLRERRHRNGQPAEGEQFNNDIKKAAHRALQSEHALCAAYDQWQSICGSNIDFDSLETIGTIQAPDVQSLASQLLDYVGVGGRYMPLTKSVDIFLPMESLRDLRIVDTPGLNDPVQSREERTTALLKNCDVIFIVSPAGQFLSEQDIELMSRITAKEGVQELVLIASQVDNQLYGSDTRQPTLQGALDTVVQALSSHMVDTLQRLKVQQPEIGSTFDSLIQGGAGKVLYTSGMCHSLSVRLDQKNDWDSGESKAWDNLQSNYPDFFPQDHIGRCQGNLNLLANTTALRAVLDSVRTQKSLIIAKRREELVYAKSTSMEAFRADLLAFVHEKYQEVRNADINELKAQRRKLDGLIEEGVDGLDGILRNNVSAFKSDLKRVLTKDLSLAYGAAEATFESSGMVDEKKEIIERSGIGAWLARGLWGGGMEEVTRRTFKLHWRKVYDGLEEFINDLVVTLSNSAKVEADKFREKLIKESTNTTRRHLGDNADTALIIRTNRGLVSRIEIPEFEITTSALKRLRRGGTTLQDSEAKEYLDEAKDLLVEFKGQISKQITHFIRDIDRNIPSSYGHEFFVDMKERIRLLEEQVENALLTLDRLQRMKKDLEAA